MLKVLPEVWFVFFMQQKFDKLSFDISSYLMSMFKAKSDVSPDKPRPF